MASCMLHVHRDNHVMVRVRLYFFLFQEILPDLKEEVRNKLLETEHKLHELGADPPETPAEKRQMALTVK